MRITALQTDIVWENPKANLRSLRKKLIELCGTTEIVVLPETFSTGFSMQPSALAESNEGTTIRTLQAFSNEFEIALAGSFIATENDKYYNRAFFITPQDESFYYDKRHLFRMGKENEHYTPGCERTVAHYKGWKILLQVCYDLRFPVYSRNRNNEYDLILYVANWPQSRRYVWDILIQARAIENLCYVCAVNRTGCDGNGVIHNGGSVILSPKGEVLAVAPDNEESAATATLSIESLNVFRNKFPVWLDADAYCLP